MDSASGGSSRPTASPRPHSPAMTASEVLALLNDSAKLSRPWVAGMCLVAILTAIEVDRPAGEGVSFTFRIDSTTLIAVALIWLPALLKVLALVGGSFKAAGMEASVAGVLSRADAIELNVRARQITSAGTDGERAAAAQELVEAIVRLAPPPPEPDASLPDATLSQLARSYERLRRDMAPGAARTSAMTRIVNEVRVRAADAPERAKLKGLELVRSSMPGDRLVGLALIQESAASEAFSEVLGLVNGSSSAFEMYHALLALQEMSNGLSLDQKRNAMTVLEHELTDPRGIGVNQDPGLPSLLRRTLGVLSGFE